MAVSSTSTLAIRLELLECTTQQSFQTEQSHLLTAACTHCSVSTSKTGAWINWATYSELGERSICILVQDNTFLDNYNSQRHVTETASFTFPLKQLSKD